MVYYGNMKTQYININSIEEYANYLRNRIGLLEKKLALLPENRLTISQSHGNLQFYCRTKGNNKRCYLSKKNTDQISGLANKYYINKTLPILKKNLYAAEKFIALHSAREERDVYSSMPQDLQILNNNLFLYKPKFIETWQKRPYVRNPYKNESLIYDSARGDKVRSKSEVIIANSFFKHELAYLVEFPFKLKQSNKTIYPDFTILNPNTLKEVYWEHFGMMDDPEYANAAVKRIQMLNDAGLMLGKNLICTFESSNTPLSSSLVESYIQEFLLT